MTGIIDFHIHTAPSLVPRHHLDTGIAEVMRQAGITTFVIKAHEGSTAARAALIGDGAIGGVVLNSPVGGANPDAVQTAARLGGRLVWLPTISAPAHIANLQSRELSLHEGMTASGVDLIDESGRPLPAWHDVFDVVAEHNLILASGHLTTAETVTFFSAASEHGVTKFLVNHPMLPFLQWDADLAPDLQKLDARFEVGPLADLLMPDREEGGATVRLAELYPDSLLVFGSDLGHAHSPGIQQGVEDWVGRMGALLGEKTVDDITRRNGESLLTQ